MLTGKQVRVRVVKGQLIPQYIEPNAKQWLQLAEQLLLVYRGALGQSRTELEESLDPLVGEGPASLLHQGLAKLLEDRCEYEVAAGQPPEELRQHVFAAAALARSAGAFDRAAVLAECAAELGVEVPQLEVGLFADLKDEQRLLSFQEIAPAALLHRYNTALAQAILLRCTQLEVRVSGETPARYRGLFRALKFHKLMATIHDDGAKGYRLVVDGPLSLFSSTQKYGMQLANFLPALLHCKRFELEARVNWGPQRKAHTFRLTTGDSLQSHLADFGIYTPPELAQFEAHFRREVPEWEISSEPQPIAVEGTAWVPDYTLTHRLGGHRVYVEIVGFWRSVDVRAQLKRLHRALPKQFLLCLTESQNTEEAAEATDDSAVVRYKRLPSATAIAHAAEGLM